MAAAARSLLRGLTAVGFALSVCAIAEHAVAATYTVCNAGCSFTTIAQAVSIAQDGDTVSLTQNTYVLTNDIPINGKDLTIVGMGRAATTITVETDIGFRVATGSNVAFEDLTLTADGASTRGISVDGATAKATVSNARVTGFWNSGLVASNGSEVTIIGSRFDLHRNEGALIGIGGAKLTVIGCEFDENRATEGAHITLSNGASLSVAGSTTTFGLSYVDGNGGAISAVTSARFDVDSAVFTAGEATRGGAIYADDTAASSITRSTFLQNQGNGGGGAIYLRKTFNAVPAATLTIEECSFEENSGYEGGALLVTPHAAVAVDRSRFVSNVADSRGGAIRTGAPASVSIRRTTFCQNSATDTGGAIDAAGGGATWSNLTFVENMADAAGGAVHASGPLTLRNSDFLANQAPASLGGGARVSGDVTLVNNLVAFTTSGDGVSYGSGTIAPAYSGWFSNVALDVSGSVTSLPSSNLLVDPQLVGYVPGQGCTNLDVRLRPGSPLIDGGDPVLLDPDGSRSDIGSTGGPDAEPEYWSDSDNDGSVLAYDCNDQDDTISPLEPEMCNGLDDDCDGAPDDGDPQAGSACATDLEGVCADGTTACVAGVLECEAVVEPGSLSEICNGVDDDCNGVADDELECGAAGGGAAGGGNPAGGSSEGGAGEGGAGEGGSAEGGAGGRAQGGTDPSSGGSVSGGDDGSGDGCDCAARAAGPRPRAGLIVLALAALSVRRRVRRVPSRAA